MHVNSVFKVPEHTDDRILTIVNKQFQDLLTEVSRKQYSSSLFYSYLTLECSCQQTDH